MILFLDTGRRRRRPQLSRCESRSALEIAREVREGVYVTASSSEFVLDEAVADGVEGLLADSVKAEDLEPSPRKVA